MDVRKSWSGEPARWKRILFEVPLVGLSFLALLVGLAAYQVKRPQVIDVGGGYDAPYLQAFHDPESYQQDPASPRNFRWTRERVQIDLLGIGQQPVELRLYLQAYRPSGAPPEAALFFGESRLFAGRIGPQWAVYRALLPAQVLSDGDLHLELRSEVFFPENDPRQLGVSVDWIEVWPAGVGWVEPAWPQVGSLLGIALLGYLLLRRWGTGRSWSSATVVLVLLLLGIVLAFHRLSLTYFTPTLVLLLAVGCLLTALALPLLERWHLDEGKGPGWARLLWIVLLLGLLVRLGGMLYPQFRSSDLIFHAHRLAWVMSGDLLFTADLPDVNIPAPYPPGLYVSLLPVTPVFADLPLLLEIAGVVLHTGCGFLLYLLALRLTGRPAWAFLALLLQEIAPVTLKIYSWGNYTNLFSRAALMGVLVILCLGRWREGRVRGMVLLAGSFSVVLLAHFADSLIFGFLALIVVGLALLTWEGRRVMPRLLLALLAAVVFTALLYYLAPPIWEALLGGLEAFAEGEGRSPVLSNPIEQVFAFVQAPLVLLVLPGLLLLLGKDRQRRWPAVVLASVLLTAAVFGLGQAAFGFSTRYALFVLPVLALGSAGVLLPLWRRGWAGRLVVGVLVGYMLWIALLEWHQLIVLGQR